MPLDPGKQLGPYEILERIGEGGMGEVYKARDSRLDRTVAIKFSKEQFGERFEREARTIAALNHPHVCQLYDVGPNYLVMELVDGKTLQGPMPLDEALRIAGQIADALEAAHEKGIVHRDLKPGNIVLREDGSVKVLDFGLAKVTAAVSSELTQNSPTISMAATQAGVVLGTAAYMSPEQARGKPATPRADIWAFGVVLYEMLTGKRLFEGEDLTETLASVVKEQPDLSGAPVEVRRLLLSCLQKDPTKRLKAIGDWRLLLDEPRAAEPVTTKPSSTAKVAWLIAGLAAVLAAAAFLSPRRPPEDKRVFKMSVVMPDDVLLNTITPATRFKISPDGQTLAFIGRKASRQIWIRSLASTTAQPLNGTEEANVVAWSPDGKHLAFSARGKLRKIDVSGGTPIPLGDMQNNTGIAWSPGNVILFQPTGKSVLYQVSAAGGMATPATTIDDKKETGEHWQPFFLPDGKHFLYHATGGAGAVYVGSLDQTEKARLLLSGGSNAQFADGYVLFMRDSVLMAQRLNDKLLQLEGEAVPVAARIQAGGDTGRTGAFSVSEAGVLVYQTGNNDASGNARVVWLDREGTVADTINQSGNNAVPRLSPDEKRLAVERRAQAGYDIWILDLARGTNTRLTFADGAENDAVWSPDGTRIAFKTRSEGKYVIYTKLTNGVGEEELLLKMEGSIGALSDWSSDGKYILFTADSDIWFLPLFGDKKPQRIMKTPFEETQPRLSPDGRWLAYSSNESASPQVYVLPFPPSPTGQRVQISVKGGVFPRWGGNGKELFYAAPEDRKLVAVSLKFPGTTVEAGPENRLWSPPPNSNANFAVTADGKRFLVSTRSELNTGKEGVESPLTVVVNWTADLKTTPGK